MTAPIDTMPRLGSSSSSSSSNRASARARVFPAVVSGVVREARAPHAGGRGEPEDSDCGKAAPTAIVAQGEAGRSRAGAPG